MLLLLLFIVVVVINELSLCHGLVQLTFKWLEVNRLSFILILA